MGSAGVAAVTGATGGIGAAFARALASQGYDLLLTDKDAVALDVLTRELRGGASVAVETTVADLTRDADIERLQAQLAAMDELVLLVNNAGFGTYSLFHEADLGAQLDMVSVHVLAAMRFCHAVLPGMIARHGGTIINVASAGAFLRFPRDTTYIGSKAFLVAFTECLAIELVNTGVTVQALCPAWVRTGFSASGDYAKIGYRSPIPDWLFTSPEQVVTSSLHSVGKGSVTQIPTIRARMAVKLIGSRLGLAALARIRRRRRREDAL
jgi:short-subunit dehydrogenase